MAGERAQRHFNRLPDEAEAAVSRLDEAVLASHPENSNDLAFLTAAKYGKTVLDM